MEDGSGNVVSPATRRAVTAHARAFWQEKFNKGIPLPTLTNTDRGLRQEFRAYMEGEYPWLCYCADHWKADQIWRDKFSKWVPAPIPEGSPQGEMPAGKLKRERPTEDDQAGPSSKRSRTKAPANPPRSKTTARVGFQFVIIYTVAEHI